VLVLTPVEEAPAALGVPVRPGPATWAEAWPVAITTIALTSSARMVRIVMT